MAALWLGVGCGRAIAAADLDALLERMLHDHHVPVAALTGLASLDRRHDEPALTGLAARLGLVTRFFAAERLAQEAGRLVRPSARVLAVTGCPGIAEGAALAAAGPGAELIVPKIAQGRITLALARERIAPAPARCDADHTDATQFLTELRPR